MSKQKAIEDLIQAARSLRNEESNESLSPSAILIIEKVNEVDRLREVEKNRFLVQPIVQPSKSVKKDLVKYNVIPLVQNKSEESVPWLVLGMYLLSFTVGFLLIAFMFLMIMAAGIVSFQ